jgi:hypothetical protein
LSDDNVERLAHAQLGHRVHYGTSTCPVSGTASTSAGAFRYDPARNQQQKTWFKNRYSKKSIEDTVFKREYRVELVRKSVFLRLRVISSVRCDPLLHACQRRVSEDSDIGASAVVGAGALFGGGAVRALAAARAELVICGKKGASQLLRRCESAGRDLQVWFKKSMCSVVGCVGSAKAQTNVRLAFVTFACFVYINMSVQNKSFQIVIEFGCLKW